MGSLASRPSVPATQTVIYKTVSSDTSTTDSSTSTTSGDTSTNTEQTAAEVREENLLSRDRGRSGTVVTSFRGLLDMIESQEAERKTLLGQ